MKDDTVTKMSDVASSSFTPSKLSPSRLSSSRPNDSNNTDPSWNKSFFSLVDPIQYIQKFKCSPTTATSSFLQAFSHHAKMTMSDRHDTLQNGSNSTRSIQHGNSAGTRDNTASGGSDNTSLDSSLLKLNYIKPWLEYYQVPSKIDLFPDLTKNLEQINASITQKLDDLVRGNTQVLLLGAALGAAITAGVALGIGSVFVVIWNWGSHGHGSRREYERDNEDPGGIEYRWDSFPKKILNSISFFRRRRVFMQGRNNHNTSTTATDAGTDAGTNIEIATDKRQKDKELIETKISREKSLQIIVGLSCNTCTHDTVKKVADLSSDNKEEQQKEEEEESEREKESHSSSPPFDAAAAAATAATACRQCLDSITLQLGKKGLGWCHVLRITAYLVQEACDALTFREILKKEYPCGSSMGDQNVVVQVVYVKALEDPKAIVQVEALVQS